MKYNKTNQNMNKKAQVTIFIILALILIVVIVIIFLLRQSPEVEIVDDKNPQAYIEGCTRDAVEEALGFIMLYAGDIEQQGNVMFQGTNISYLCYNKNYYLPCVNQKPLLIEHIQDEISEYIKPRVSNCFQTLKQNLGPRYEVEMEENWKINK